MTPLDAAWQAVFEHPEDDGARLVLGDALLEVGSPHGELIRLQSEPAPDEEAINAFIATNSIALLGSAERLTQWRPRFRRGFIDSAAVDDIDGLRALFGLPAARLLRLLDIGSHLNASMEVLMDLILSRAPSTMQSLLLGRPGQAAYLPGTVKVARLLETFDLKELVLGSWSNDFDEARGNSLERLVLNLHHSSEHLGEARFPSLRSLRLWLPFQRLELPTSLLAGEVAPRLKSLTVFGAFWPDHVGELSVSALLRGLEHLEISADVGTGWPEAMLETIDRFQHLQRVDVRLNRRPDLEEALREALPRVVIHGARVGGV